MRKTSRNSELHLILAHISSRFLVTITFFHKAIPYGIGISARVLVLKTQVYQYRQVYMFAICIVKSKKVTKYYNTYPQIPHTQICPKTRLTSKTTVKKTTPFIANIQNRSKKKKIKYKYFIFMFSGEGGRVGCGLRILFFFFLYGISQRCTYSEPRQRISNMKIVFLFLTHMKYLSVIPFRMSPYL